MPKCSSCGTENPKAFEDSKDTICIECWPDEDDDLEDEGDLDYGWPDDDE